MSSTAVTEQLPQLDLTPKELFINAREDAVLALGAGVDPDTVFEQFTQTPIIEDIAKAKLQQLLPGINPNDPQFSLEVKKLKNRIENDTRVKLGYEPNLSGVDDSVRTNSTGAEKLRKILKRNSADDNDKKSSKSKLVSKTTGKVVGNRFTKPGLDRISLRQVTQPINDKNELNALPLGEITASDEYKVAHTQIGDGEFVYKNSDKDLYALVHKIEGSDVSEQKLADFNRSLAQALDKLASSDKQENLPDTMAMLDKIVDTAIRKHKLTGKVAATAMMVQNFEDFVYSDQVLDGSGESLKGPQLILANYGGNNVNLSYEDSNELAELKFGIDNFDEDIVQGDDEVDYLGTPDFEGLKVSSQNQGVTSMPLVGLERIMVTSQSKIRDTLDSYDEAYFESLSEADAEHVANQINAYHEALDAAYGLADPQEAAKERVMAMKKLEGNTKGYSALIMDVQELSGLEEEPVENTNTTEPTKASKLSKLKPNITISRESLSVKPETRIKVAKVAKVAGAAVVAGIAAGTLPRGQEKFNFKRAAVAATASATAAYLNERRRSNAIETTAQEAVSSENIPVQTEKSGLSTPEKVLIGAGVAALGAGAIYVAKNKLPEDFMDKIKQVVAEAKPKERLTNGAKRAKTSYDLMLESETAKRLKKAALKRLKR